MSSKQIDDSPIKQDENGNMFLWGSNLKVRNFDTNKFSYIRDFLMETWSRVEMQDLLVARASITEYNNHFGVVVFPAKEFQGVYARAKITKCGKCGGATKAMCISRRSDGLYEQAIFQDNSRHHEFGCEYYLVQNIMEV